MKFGKQSTKALKSGHRISFSKKGGEESMSFIFIDYSRPREYGTELNEISSNYFVVKQLGEGSTGEVSMGIDKMDGSQVAIKLVDNFKGSFKFRKMQLEREIYILKQMNHESIVSVIKYLKNMNQVCFSMQLANCGTLYQFINRGQMMEDKLKNLMHQIFIAIKYVHGKGIVHRALKPVNICCNLNDSLEMKIIIVDFGFGIEFKHKSYTAPELIGYVSKENGGGDCDDKVQYDPSSDVWSLGVIMFESFCGEQPFKNVKEIENGTFNFNNPKWENVSDGPKDIINRILVSDPKSRITIDDILDHQWFK